MAIACQQHRGLPLLMIGKKVRCLLQCKGSFMAPERRFATTQQYVRSRGLSRHCADIVDLAMLTQCGPTALTSVVAASPRSVGKQMIAHSSGSPAFRKPSITINAPGSFSRNDLIVSCGLTRRASAKADFASASFPFAASAPAKYA